MAFTDLGLSGKVLQAVESSGYTQPTPIQAEAIPHVLARRDVLGIAQTGTGKTAAFTLPMLSILENGRARARMPRTLILEPTRELAAQVEDSFVKYGANHRLNVALLIGGVSFGDQDAKITRGADVLIATPGRLLDHIERGKLLLSGIEVLVIDEADRMLDMGFIPDIERICKMVPFTRQTLFFSATMPPEIQKLVDNFLSNPVRIEVAPPASSAATITQLAVASASDAPEKRKTLRMLIDGAEELKNGIIFCNRKRDIAVVQRSLEKHGYSVVGLHGDMDQRSRMQALDRFRNNDVQLLIASDVAARGLDIPDVSHVFNYDTPHHAEDYVHRIGRTGRAGRKGTAYTIITPDDNKNAAAIVAMTGKEFDWLGGNTVADVAASPDGADGERNSDRRRGRDGREGRRVRGGGGREGRGREGSGREGSDRDKNSREQADVTAAPAQPASDPQLVEQPRIAETTSENSRQDRGHERGPDSRRETRNERRPDNRADGGNARADGRHDQRGDNRSGGRNAGQSNNDSSAGQGTPYGGSFGNAAGANQRDERRDERRARNNRMDREEISPPGFGDHTPAFMLTKAVLLKRSDDAAVKSPTAEANARDPGPVTPVAFDASVAASLPDEPRSEKGERKERRRRDRRRRDRRDPSSAPDAGVDAGFAAGDQEPGQDQDPSRGQEQGHQQEPGDRLSADAALTQQPPVMQSSEIAPPARLASANQSAVQVIPISLGSATQALAPAPAETTVSDAGDVPETVVAARPKRVRAPRKAVLAAEPVAPEINESVAPPTRARRKKADADVLPDLDASLPAVVSDAPDLEQAAAKTPARKRAPRKAIAEKLPVEADATAEAPAAAPSVAKVVAARPAAKRTVKASPRSVAKSAAAVAEPVEAIAEPEADAPAKLARPSARTRTRRSARTGTRAPDASATEDSDA